MAQKIAVLSQKGGTGKTTAVRHLADAFRRAGLSVLAVDLDPQGNLSDYFDVPPDAAPTVGDVLSGQAKLAEAIHDGVVPANLHLGSVESALTGKIGRELTLRKALKPVDGDWDVVLIDCPPNLGLLAVCGLVAADFALLSAQAQHFALEGVAQALEVVELVRDGLNADLELLGIAFTIADLRTVHSRDAVASLREDRPGDVLETVVRQSIAYAESAERAKSILDHRPDLGADYVLLADELLGRLGLDAARKKLKPLVKDARARATSAA